MVRDFETIRRSILRKANWGLDKSSYPFISGDTYKALCDFELSPSFSSQFNKIGSQALRDERLLYVSAQFAEEFIVWLKIQGNLDFSKWHLLLHNWDDIPSQSNFEYLASRFETVAANHWHGDLKIAKPLPIGLENWDLQRNGIPRDFRKMQKKGLRRFQSRDIEVLCSFSVNTNLKERAEAWNFCTSLDNAFLMPAFTTPAKYRSLVARSKFVISPPGNGADCHRTWEAIYLGAVPIVLREYWGYEHWKLPVLIVDNWSEATLAMSNYNPQEPMSVDELKKLFLDDSFLRKQFSE